MTNNTWKFYELIKVLWMLLSLLFALLYQLTNFRFVSKVSNFEKVRNEGTPLLISCKSLYGNALNNSLGSYA